MSAGGSPRPWPKVGLARRYGPVALIVAGLLAAGAGATVAESSTQSTSSAGHRASVSTAQVPPTYAAATKAGRVNHYDWSPQCDRATGRLKMPTVFAPPCVPVFSGANGGQTWNGVSANTVNVVYYQPPPGDLTAAVQGAAGNPAANQSTARAFVDLLNHVVELYGRHVHLVVFDATGNSSNAVAAQADAIRVAQQLHAFASIGGPGQTPAYRDELARLHVLCIGCGLSATYSDFAKDAPYLWANLPTPDALLLTTFTYVADQLNGKDAIWAGNPAWHHRRRAFAVVNYTQVPPIATGLTKELNRLFVTDHVHMALRQSLTYQLNLATLPDQAATIAAKLKASGATTVIFAGDPIMPIYLTKACAAIGYFPEWVITGTVYTDTSTLGRYYDQREWAHAFGVSSLPVPTPISQSEAYRVYRWWFGSGTTPAAAKTAGVILPPLSLLFEGIELAGPHLTPTTFAAGLFRAPPAGGGPTTPLAAYGFKGAPPTPSYSSPADYTYIWYEATAKGPDEEGVPGTGLIRYVEGGKRYRLGQVPKASVPMFSTAGSVTRYQVAPAGDRPPSYPPWPGSPASVG